jgi:hypothetical protein
MPWKDLVTLVFFMVIFQVKIKYKSLPILHKQTQKFNPKKKEKNEKESRCKV